MPKHGAYFCNTLNGQCNPGDGSNTSGFIPMHYVDGTCPKNGGGVQPAKATGVTPCTFRCKPGLIAPNCVTALQAFIDAVGGIYVFVGGLGLCAAIFAFTFCVVCRRAPCCSVYQQRQRAYLQMDQMDDMRRLPGSSPSAGRGTGGGAGEGDVGAGADMDQMDDMRRLPGSSPYAGRGTGGGAGEGDVGAGADMDQMDDMRRLPGSSPYAGRGAGGGAGEGDVGAGADMFGIPSRERWTLA